MKLPITNEQLIALAQYVTAGDAMDDLSLVQATDGVSIELRQADTTYVTVDIDGSWLEA